ncbi:MAG: prolipoprotein diacylglyceryl transferase [Rickettsiales bacterium]|jgi:phosphatidylglycerol:prolipoprotein diacylglycerol transferase|nr:prolipoprotein diacylglyceryl transferase [Rickettsiales bacterium]
MAFIFPNIDPVILSISNTPLKITWYSLSYLAGILLSWIYIKHLNKLNKTNPLETKKIDDLITYIIIGIIIGGRLGYVLFYDFFLYLSNPLQILRTWEGGMSFHGGLLGVIIASYIFCRIHKVEFFRVMDLLACATPIGLFLGRIANFINGELYGRTTEVAWGVIFPNQILPRHPSQLYESLLEGLILFLILFFLYDKIRKFKGMASGLFLLLYSLFRGLIENYREPDLHIGFVFAKITMGQLLSIPMILAGSYIIYYSIKHKQK